MLDTQMTKAVDNEVDRRPEEPKTEKTTNYNIPMIGTITFLEHQKNNLHAQSPSHLQ